MEAWVGCLSGALDVDTYATLLREVGFEAPSIEPTRIYRAEDATAFLAGSGLDADAVAEQVDGKFMSAFVRAVKPAATPRRELATAESRSCCGRTAAPDSLRRLDQ
jgi:hypothetical protein